MAKWCSCVMTCQVVSFPRIFPKVPSCNFQYRVFFSILVFNSLPWILLPIVCAVTFWANVTSYNAVQFTVPHLNCTFCEELSSAVSSRDGCLIWPFLALLLKESVNSHSLPVHPLLVTRAFLPYPSVVLSWPGESLLIQKLFHTSDYPRCPSCYCLSVRCIPSKLRGPDVNTHLGCRHSMSFCDGDMLLCFDFYAFPNNL